MVEARAAPLAELPIGTAAIAREQHLAAPTMKPAADPNFIPQQDLYRHTRSMLMALLTRTAETAVAERAAAAAAAQQHEGGGAAAATEQPAPKRLGVSGYGAGGPIKLPARYGEQQVAAPRTVAAECEVELQQYEREAERLLADTPPTYTVLGFWKERVQQNLYLRIAPFARTFLGVRPTSVDPERKASEAGNTLGPKRSSMLYAKAEACLFVKSNADLLTDANAVPVISNSEVSELYPKLFAVETAQQAAAAEAEGMDLEGGGAADAAGIESDTDDEMYADVEGLID
jgi:hypothetical protein